MEVKQSLHFEKEHLKPSKFYSKLHIIVKTYFYFFKAYNYISILNFATHADEKGTFSFCQMIKAWR